MAEQFADLKFDNKGLIPAIVQDASTKDVLMMAYMNKESLDKTLETGNTWFYSRSRQELWMKGKTSGNVQAVKEIRYDCDNDTLLVFVEPKGPACHTGERTCFHRNLQDGVNKPEEIEEVRTAVEGSILDELYELIVERKKQMPEGSYTTKLFKEGMGKIAAKVSEESTEVIEAAFEKNKGEVVWEAADLIYHLMVLLAAKDVDFADVKKELKHRRTKSSK